MSDEQTFLCPIVAVEYDSRTTECVDCGRTAEFNGEPETVERMSLNWLRHHAALHGRNSILVPGDF